MKEWCKYKTYKKCTSLFIQNFHCFRQTILPTKGHAWRCFPQTFQVPLFILSIIIKIMLKTVCEYFKPWRLFCDICRLVLMACWQWLPIECYLLAMFFTAQLKRNNTNIEWKSYPSTSFTWYMCLWKLFRVCQVWTFICMLHTYINNNKQKTLNTYFE